MSDSSAPTSSGTESGTSYPTDVLPLLHIRNYTNQQLIDAFFDCANLLNNGDYQGLLVRAGLDINQLAADYRRRFNGRELPHPKMDALVSHLSKSWTQGRKALVFLRRVASVWEVKERLDLRYNEWLIQRLRDKGRDLGRRKAQILGVQLA